MLFCIELFFGLLVLEERGVGLKGRDRSENVGNDMVVNKTSTCREKFHLL